MRETCRRMLSRRGPRLQVPGRPCVKRARSSARFPHARSDRRRPPRSTRRPPAEGPKRTSISGEKMHRFLTAAWEELDHELRRAMPNAQKPPSWEFYDRLAGSRDLAPTCCTHAMERSRRRGGRKSLPPINRSPVSARGAHETEPCWSGLCGRPRNEAREVILCPAVSSACRT